MARKASGNPFIRSALRQVRDTLPRYLSILLITLIGVAFFAGLRLTGPYMKDSAELWFDQLNMMDIQVYSTLGFDADDLVALSATPGIAKIAPGYHTNVLVKRNDSEVSAQFLSLSYAYDSIDTIDPALLGDSPLSRHSSVLINAPQLLDGRLPISSQECLAEEEWLRHTKTSLGSKVRVYSGTDDPIDSLAFEEFIVVGVAKSPLFAAEERGSSEIGNGSNAYFFLVLPEAFVLEVYTTVYVQADFATTEALSAKNATYVKNAAHVKNAIKRLPFSRFDPAYLKTVEPVVEALKNTGDKRNIERYNKIQADAHSALEDARVEVAKGYKALDDVAQELEDARRELEGALVELSSGRAELDNGWVQSNAGRSSLNSGWSELDASSASLNSGWVLSDVARAQLDVAHADSDSGRAQLDAAQAASAAAQAMLGNNRALLEATRTELDAGWVELSIGRAALNSGWAEYNDQLSMFLLAQSMGLLTPQQIADYQQQLADALVTLEAGEATYVVKKQELEAFEAYYQGGLAELQAGEADYQVGLLTLKESEADYQAGLKLLQDNEAAWQSGRQQLQSGEAAYQNALRQLRVGETDWQSALLKLQGSEASWGNGFEEYSQGIKEYEEGLAVFEQERAEALKDLAQAEADISKNEEDLKALKAPKWYILDLNSNPGFRSYKTECEQLEAIALIIPLLFFLIAALVSMTSMTRLVDNDRTIIGIYKALGYTNRAVTMRYLAYAFSATLIGGVVGVYVGYHLFPPLIFNAFHTLFTVPPGPIPFSWPYALLSIGVALACTVIPAVLVSLRTLRETPAAAMRPLAPPPGKRNVLERITPLWSRLSFLHKVTTRNLLRYKKRALMTIFGVAGCTALMSTGFGLNDALGTLGSKQYGDIQRFDVTISFKNSASDEDFKHLDCVLAQSSELNSYAYVHREIMDFVGATHTKDLVVLVPKDPDSFTDYYSLRSRTEGSFFKDKASYTLDDSGVIITEQIARQMDVSVGDFITLRTLNNKEAQFKVTAIVENYIHHFLVMSPALYEKGFAEKPKPNQVFGFFTAGSAKGTGSTGGTGNTTLPTSVTNASLVTGVNYTWESANQLSTMTDVLGFVMVILIVSAAAQAFVVLFSLNTINREERRRELASIKVLGFFNREIAAYIYREGFILTAIGIVLGLLGGVALERYIITTIELDVFMFSRDLLLSSFLYSALLTALFALVVNLLLYRPLTHIDMVESLKAIE